MRVRFLKRRFKKWMSRIHSMVNNVWCDPESRALYKIIDAITRTTICGSRWIKISNSLHCRTTLYTAYEFSSFTRDVRSGAVPPEACLRWGPAVQDPLLTYPTIVALDTAYEVRAAWVEHLYQGRERGHELSYYCRPRLSSPSHCPCGYEDCWNS